MFPRTVFSPYVRLFAVPGAQAFSLAGSFARLPMATLGLGAVLLVAGRTGSYALAGAVSGTLALAFSAAGPLWGRAMDRRGQGAVLRVALVANLVLGLAFAAVVVLDAPRWAWFVLAALTGVSAPNIGSLVRARWAHALPDVAQRQTAFAYESVVDEVLFVVGPPLVTVLAALVTPSAGFLTGLLLGVCGGFALARLTDSEPPVHPPDTAGRRATAALRPAVLVVGVVYAAVGSVFGAVDVVVVGFAEFQGAPVMAGAVLAAYAGGSLVAGLAYGLARLPGTLAARFVACAVFFAVAAQLLLVVRSLPVLVAVALLAGSAIAPVLVAGTSLVESRMPRAALTEGLAWTMTGLTLGVTAGAAIAGAAVDAFGAQGAFVVPAAGAALAGVLALLGAPLLRTPTEVVAGATG